MIDFYKDQGKYKYLFEQQRKKNRYTGDYILDKKHPHYKFILSHIFKGDCRLYTSNVVSSGYFKVIGDKIAQYVANPCWDIKYDIYRNVVDWVCMRKMVVTIGREDGDFVYNYEAAEKHIEIDGEDYLFTFYESEEGVIKSDFTLVQRYYMEGEFQHVQSRLFKNLHGSAISKREVPLDTLYDTKDIQPDVNTGVRKAIFVYEKDEKSEIDVAESVVYSIDKKKNLIDNELLSNVEQYTIINGLNTEKEVKKSMSSKLLANQSKRGDAPNISVDFVKNENQLIEQAISYTTEDQMSDLVALTSIPLEFWGKQSKGQVSTESRELMYNDFVAKINSTRKEVEDFWREIFDVIAEYKREEADREFYWNDVIQKDKKELLEELKLAVECGFIDRKTAFEMYRGIKDPKESQEAYNLILNDDTTNNNNEDTRSEGVSE